MSRIADVAWWHARISPKTVWTFVRVRDADGRSGWGESTLQGEWASVGAYLERAARPLAGIDVANFARALWREPAANLADAAARGGLDQALWDLAAQAAGKPLADALGTRLRSTVGLYANLNRGTLDRSPAGFAARAREAVENGFAAVKIAPFDDVTPRTVDSHEGRALVDAGIDRVHAVRAAIGRDRSLMVDCHWRFTEATASETLRRLEPAALHWFECPLVEDDASLPALRRLRAQANAAGVRLAGCESLSGREAFRTFVDAGAYDVIMPDVKYAGGLAELLAIAEEADARGVACSPHNPSGPIAHLASVHASALVASLPLLEFQSGESPLFFDLVAGELPDPRGGTSVVPARPGLGIALDVEKLAPLALREPRVPLAAGSPP